MEFPKFTTTKKKKKLLYAMSGGVFFPFGFAHVVT